MVEHMEALGSIPIINEKDRQTDRGEERGMDDERSVSTGTCCCCARKQGKNIIIFGSPG